MASRWSSQHGCQLVQYRPAYLLLAIRKHAARCILILNYSTLLMNTGMLCIIYMQAGVTQVELEFPPVKVRLTLNWMMFESHAMN
jgi:hypothetical protein